MRVIWKRCRMRGLLPIPPWTVCPDGSVALYRPFADSIYDLGPTGTSIPVPRAPQRLRDEDVLAFARGMIAMSVLAGRIDPEQAENVLREGLRKHREDFGPLAPAYVSFHCDHRHRYWFQHFSTEDDFVGFGRTWDVPSPAGELLATVATPPRFRPRVFLEDGIWGVREDTLGEVGAPEGALVPRNRHGPGTGGRS